MLKGTRHIGNQNNIYLKNHFNNKLCLNTKKKMSASYAVAVKLLQNLKLSKPCEIYFCHFTLAEYL